MGMSEHVADRERDKFRETADGDTAVGVVIEKIEDADENKLDINPDGSVNIKSSDFKNLFTEMLREMKEMNLHLKVLSDLTISPEDKK